MVRISIYSSLVRIARENLAAALSYEDVLSTLNQKLAGLTGDDADGFRFMEMTPVQNKQGDHCLIALVFSALAIEGYIYDYAARKLSDSYVSTHLDRLDVVSKYVIVPKLVTGKDFPKDGRAFQLLKQLIQNRNYIVHNKSAKVVVEVQETSEIAVGSSAKKMIQFGNSIIEKSKDAIATLDELALTIESLDPDEHTSMSFRSPVGKAKEQFEQYGFWPWGDE